MQDDIHEKISRLIDGDLEHVETLDLLKKIQSNEVLRQKMSRYQDVSQALKADRFYPVSAEFSRKIFQEIQQEPSYFLPQFKPKPNTLPQTQASKNKHFTWLAAAASVVVVAGLVWRGTQDGHMPISQPTMTALNSPQQSLPVNYSQTTQINKQPQSGPLNAQFNDYLKAHNSSVYINGEANFQPYARVASYGQD